MDSIDINNILKATFGRLQSAFIKNHECIKKPEISKKINEGKSSIANIQNRLVFPQYFNEKDKTRLSEQELRFTFIETFLEYSYKNKLDLYYSIETPTKKKYTGFAEGEPKVASDVSDKEVRVRSAEFDTVIFGKDEENKMKRLCLIEFKANNPDKDDIKKDLLKLNIDDDSIELRYFLFVIYSKKEKSTLESIANKISKAKYNDNPLDEKPICICYNLYTNKVFKYYKYKNEENEDKGNFSPINLDGEKGKES